jgi:crotonobetainyl-CoA:carnitine CoA-transferase CaiB-like acyl-CoA transferase
MSVLVSLLAREETGRGQHIDVNLHAAANVTTEAGSYEWLVARTTVQRQTGRHAGPQLTMESQVQCADGRWVNTGVPPMKPVEFKSLLDWVDSLGLGDDFPERIFLEMGMKRERIDLSRILEDQELQAIFGAGREAVNLIASRVSAYDFFTGAQKRGLSVGIIYSPEEVMDDPHFVERGFRVPVVHDKGSDPYIYPGAPIIFHGTPWRIQRRAPRLGEHDDEILGPLRRG